MRFSIVAFVFVFAIWRLEEEKRVVFGRVSIDVWFKVRIAECNAGVIIGLYNRVYVPKGGCYNTRTDYIYATSQKSGNTWAFLNIEKNIFGHVAD